MFWMVVYVVNEYMCIVCACEGGFVRFEVNFDEISVKVWFGCRVGKGW